MLFATFASVALRVEGVSISAVARVEGLAWNTVARWLEKAAYVCRGFNQRRTAGFGVEELGGRDSLFRRRENAANVDMRRNRGLVAALAVDSDRKTKLPKREARSLCCANVANRMDFERFPLIVTDGFDFYEKVVRRVLGPAALYGQVLKTRRNDRIVKVERRELMGASWRFEEVLNNSEELVDIEHVVH